MSWPAYCLCGTRIDLEALHAHKRAGLEVRHACGRVLIPKKTNAPA